MKKQQYLKPKICKTLVRSTSMQLADNFNLFNEGVLLAGCASCACCECTGGGCDGPSDFRCCNN